MFLTYEKDNATFFINIVNFYLHTLFNQHEYKLYNFL